MDNLFGNLKELASKSSLYIQERVKEDSFLGYILFEKDILSNELDKDSDLGIMKKGDVEFGTVVTPKEKYNVLDFSKSKKSFKDIVLEPCVEALSLWQDERFIRLCKGIVSESSSQDKVFYDGLLKRNFNKAVSMLPGISCCLMNCNTSKNILKWSSDDVPSLNNEVLRNEIVAGVKTLITIKKDIVLDNEIWFFVDSDFLGDFLVLQGPVFHVVIEANNLITSCDKILGVKLRNTKGILRCVFKD